MASVTDNKEQQTVQAPLCRNLRSKKYFTLQTIPVTAADVRDASNHCWCRCTMQVVGPDGRLVRPEQCAEGRACYQSPLGL